MYGHGIPMGGLTGLLILIVMIIVVYRLIKGEPGAKKKTARDILDERYARGEIDAETYKQQKQDISD